jgi:SAM-dependent methyltransferase
MNNTKRFTDRAENYRKYRPDYPAAVIEVLKKKCGLSTDFVIADIGSGTGIFAKLLLPYVRMVYAIEPNAEMRKAAEEELLSSYKNFFSLDATAEDTKLESSSIDLVTAATAFHWFDTQKTKEEFRRILKEPKWVVLIWNEKNTQRNELQIAYDSILNKYAPDYGKRRHKNIDALSIGEWYALGRSECITFRNDHTISWEGLQGRFLSSSYAPQKGQPNHEQAMEELRSAYMRYAREGAVVLEYTTKLYVGTI